MHGKGGKLVNCAANQSIVVLQYCDILCLNDGHNASWYKFGKNFEKYVLGGEGWKKNKQIKIDNEVWEERKRTGRENGVWD